MLQLDHFALFSYNIYKSTFKLSKETGLGNYDGGFFPNFGAALKIVPLGPDVFLEIQGLIDYEVMKHIAADSSSAGLDATGLSGFVHKAVQKPECFSGWCFRTDTLEELEELAKIAKFHVDHDTLNLDNAQQMMGGDQIVVVEAPSGHVAWNVGMPNVYYWPDMSKHDARYPVIPETDKRKPSGIAWVEVGGTPRQFEDWFGGYTKADDHPLRFNGKTPGLYAIAVNTDDGEIVIRRPTLNE